MWERVGVGSNCNGVVIFFSKSISVTFLINLSNIFKTRFLDNVLPALSFMESTVSMAAGAFYWLM